MGRAIKNEYNENSMAVAYCKVTGNYKDMDQCSLVVTTLADILRSAGVEFKTRQTTSVMGGRTIIWWEML